MNLNGFLGIIVAILAFGFLIFIHELGHFVMAKRAGVKVNEFAIGMGPTLFSFGKGETKYAIRAIPFGGFVAMEGEEQEDILDKKNSEAKDNNELIDSEAMNFDEMEEAVKKDDSRSFQKASLPRRASIMVAGAFMNFVFGFLIIFIITSMTPQFATLEIGEFDDTATSNQWLQVEDTIQSVNGKKVRTYSDMSYQFMRDKDGIMELEVLRNGEKIKLDKVEFKMAEVADGLYMVASDFRVYPQDRTIPVVFRESFSSAKNVTKQIWASLYDLVTGNVSVKHLSGPVGITKDIGEMSSQGDWTSTFLFIAMISINLGIVNLLPLPALDGGKLLFLIIEAIRGKKINPKFEMYVNAAGMILLLGLMAVVTLKDIIGLF